jgi:hypothetical protein
MEENNNLVKIGIMLDLLSAERKKEVEFAIANTIAELSKNIKSTEADLLHGKVIELTIAFDKEEPFQYVYLIGQLYKIENNFIPEMMKKFASASSIQFITSDIEVFKQDTIESWLDYKNKLEKQKSETAYYENQSTGEKTVDGQQVKDMPSDEKDITENELYDYYSEHIPKYDVWDYLDKFNFASKSIVNNVFESKIYQKHWGEEHCLKQNVKIVLALQNYFSAVDFTEFSKFELEHMGFINYKEKCMLVPIWAYPIVLRNHKGLEVETVTGENKIIGVDIINAADKKNYESRIGVVRFGIKITSIRKEEDE